MRKTSVVLVAVALLAVSSMAHAATMTPNAGMKGMWFIGPMGGLSIPSGDLNKDFSSSTATTTTLDQGMGWDIGGVVDYGVSNNLSIGLDGAFNQSKSKDNVPSSPGTDVKAKTTAFGVHGSWFLPTGGKILPYLGVGVGYYNRKIDVEGGGVSESAKKGSIGVNGGVGVAFPLSSGLGVGVDARYHWTAKDKYDFGSSLGTTGDINWSFITINAVVGWSFSPGGHTASGM